ncbi:MAG: hypothetical protein WBQ11_01610 [Isosphaeraceae bacterium]
MCDLGRAGDPGDDETPQRFDFRDDRRELVRRVWEIRVEMFGKHGVSGLAEIPGIPPRI